MNFLHLLHLTFFLSIFFPIFSFFFFSYLFFLPCRFFLISKTRSRFRRAGMLVWSSPKKKGKISPKRLTVATRAACRPLKSPIFTPKIMFAASPSPKWAHFPPNGHQGLSPNARFVPKSTPKLWLCGRWLWVEIMRFRVSPSIPPALLPTFPYFSRFTPGEKLFFFFFFFYRFGCVCCGFLASPLSLGFGGFWGIFCVFGGLFCLFVFFFGGSELRCGLTTPVFGIFFGVQHAQPLTRGSSQRF